MPEHPRGDTYVTPTRCPVCGAALTGRTDRRYCSHTCRQAAYRNRTQAPTPPAPALPAAGRTRRQHTVYECSECGQRLAGQQWCTEGQHPARRIGPGGTCPSCGDAVTIAELTEAPMP